MAAYSIQQYKFPSYLNFDISLVKTDNNSDDQAATDASTALWVPGEKRTPADKGAWDFTEIRKANYFFQQVLPKYEAGSIKGRWSNDKTLHWRNVFFACLPVFQ